MKNLKLALLILILLPVSQSFAAKDDYAKEIVIVASRQATDLKRKIASYLDDVVITQGSLKIEADEVQVASVPDSDLKTYRATGNPARFKQTLEDGTPIELEAKVITYEPQKNLITVTGDAVVSQEGTIVKGENITYNLVTEQLLAESASTGPVTTILQPKNKTENQEQQ